MKLGCLYVSSADKADFENVAPSDNSAGVDKNMKAYAVYSNPLVLQITLSLALISAGLSSASADDLPNPPTYFSMFRIDLAVAQDVAEKCSTLEIDKEKYTELAEEQMHMLEDDGFSRENWRLEMKDIPIGLRDRPRTEFYMKWGVSANDETSYCNAGEMEIRHRSTIGSLLRTSQ